MPARSYLVPNLNMTVGGGGATQEVRADEGKQKHLEHSRQPAHQKGNSKHALQQFVAGCCRRDGYDPN